MTQGNLFDLAEGRRRREAGLDRVETHYASYLQRARAAAWDHAVRFGRVSINDVRQAIGPPPAEVHHNVMGAVFRGREWEPVGIVHVKHPAGHARRVLVYALR